MIQNYYILSIFLVIANFLFKYEELLVLTKIDTSKVRTPNTNKIYKYYTF
jgi:hypothetical protein